MFELINKFVTCTTAEKMCVVKTKGGISVVSEKEYEQICRQYHPEKWNRKQVA